MAGLMKTDSADSVALLYHEAVASQSPGLPLSATLGYGNQRESNRNAVASADAAQSGLIMIGLATLGLQQLWALRRNRFAVDVPFCIL